MADWVAAEGRYARLGQTDLRHRSLWEERRAQKANLRTPTPLDPDSARSSPARVVKKLGPRWFLMRDAHAPEGLLLVQPRWACRFLRGPMTRDEIKRALAMRSSTGKPET